MLDFLGKEINVGDTVAYARLSRGNKNPMQVGIVETLIGGKFDKLMVKSDNNTKSSRVLAERCVVLNA